MAGSFQITQFDYRKEAKPGELTDTCWGEALNTGTNDYVGIAIVDVETQEQMQGGVSSTPIPSGYSAAWTSEKDWPMPDRDVNATCFVGYYVPAEQTIYATDSRDFIIKKIAGGAIPWTSILIGGGVALAAILIVPKLKK